MKSLRIVGVCFDLSGAMPHNVPSLDYSEFTSIFTSTHKAWKNLPIIINFSNPGTQQAMIEITESGQTYLKQLLDKQDCEGIAIRVFVLDGGTPKAETCIAFCRPGEEQEDDEVFEYTGFNAFVEKKSKQYLEEAVVDFAKDSMGGQLTIRAPNSRMPKINEDSPLDDRINYILYNEINPGLAAHGGFISLEEVTEDGIVVLRFGGGCQGCGMVDVTLKDGVEKSLMEQLPQIKEIRDVTDHSIDENAYYK